MGWNHLHGVGRIIFLNARRFDFSSRGTGTAVCRLVWMRASTAFCSANHFCNSGSRRACSSASANSGSDASSPPGRYACRINLASWLFMVLSISLRLRVEGNDFALHADEFCGKRLAHQVLRPRKTRHNRPDGNVEQFGNFRVGMVLKIVERQWYAVALIEFKQRPAHRFVLQLVNRL